MTTEPDNSGLAYHQDVLEHCNHCGCDECVDIYYAMIEKLLQRVFGEDALVPRRGVRHRREIENA